MNIIDQASVKLCILVGDDRRVVRTLTDGDVRRALLSGASFDTTVGTLPGTAPIMFPVGTDPKILLQAMRDHAIQAVVLTDTVDAPVDVIARMALEEMILLSPPHVGTTEVALIQEVFNDNWVAPAGPHLASFEDKLKAVSGRQHALALSSGTAGLHLALRVLNVGPSDRVYVSDLTFVASLQPILYQGATPVLIDAEPVGWNMSPAALGRQLAADATAGALPAAILVVHLYGQSADMSAIMALADQYNIPVVEDAAESLGATYKNRASGAHGLLSVYSFNGNKIITTSGGGALVSDRGDLINKARNLSQQGRDDAEHYQHSQIAYNYRMSNILAGIGMAQIDMLPDRVASRRALFDRYRVGLKDIPGIRFQENLPGGQGTRWLTVIDLDPSKIARHPYQFMRRLRSQGIETRPAWKPMHLQPLCAGMAFVPHGPDEFVSGGLYLRSLCLPSGSSLTEANQDRIIEAVRFIARED
jgi:dTDP-4-amino-4,6-dideoxygalactose transaminase